MNEFSNRIAHHFQSKGFKAGDIVGLFMENRPEFVCIWLGLSKIGVICPLINTNLRLASLLHSITVAKCNALIFGNSLISAVDEIELPSSVSLYQFNDRPNEPVKENAQDLQVVMQSASAENVSSKDNQQRHHNKLLYIYTSGTTGLPVLNKFDSAEFSELRLIVYRKPPLYRIPDSFSLLLVSIT